MSEDAPGPPPSRVLEQFEVNDELARLTGGQGRTFGNTSVVLKRVDDEEEADFVSRTTLLTDPRGFRLARPLASRQGSFVVDGWVAWSRVRGEHRFDRPTWPLVCQTSRRFHAAVSAFAEPSFIARRLGNFALADRVAWGEADVALPPPVGVVVAELRAMARPCRDPLQLIHGDFASNLLFVEDGQPAVIDWSVYFRPASYALALSVVDWTLWYDGGEELLDALAPIEGASALVARALVFRLAIAGLFAARAPAHWAVVMDRDLRRAASLLRFARQ